jgi:plasmid stabilization system protein ParE
LTVLYRLTPAARQGVFDVAEYVAERFGVDVALRALTELERAFERLGQYPDIGHFRADLTPDVRLRFWSIGPTLIAYRRGGPGIEILFVERGELDWERLLDEGLTAGRDLKS